MYLVAEIDQEICSSTSCRLCTQFCPESNTIQYDEGLGAERGSKYGSAYVAVDRCKGCAICVWVCDTMAKHHAIKLEMIDQIPEIATTVGIQYTERGAVATFVKSGVASEG